MPPIHPALVRFPIALVFVSVIADLIGRLKENEALRATGAWSLFGALIGAAVAAPVGYWDMTRMAIPSGAHDDAHRHMYFGLALLAAIALLAGWRWTVRYKEGRRVGWGYFSAAILLLGLTFYQGYLGHELVVAHGVGVSAPGRSAGAEGRGSGHEHEHEHRNE